jgi:hypothetical protein
LNKDSNNTTTKTDTTNVTKDSNNTTTANTTTNTDTGNTTNSYKDTGNTTTSYKDTGNTNTTTSNTNSGNTIGDIAVAVASTTLTGTVSGNAATLGASSIMTTGYNNIDGNAFQNASGITSVTQNSGVNSLIQSPINVQSNMSLTPSH